MSVKTTATFGPWWGTTVKPTAPRHTIQVIQRSVARHYNYTVAELCSSRRTADVVWPRHIAMYLCKTMTARSISEIGRRFGGRDHATILYGADKIAKLMSENPRIADEIAAVKATLV